MEPKLFIEKLEASKQSDVVSKLSNYGLTWNQWAKFTKITSNLDYGCNFKTKGKNICSYGSKSGLCCCYDYGPSIGYLRLIPKNKKAIKEIASQFNYEHGFWRREKGCILITKYRSSTCINFRCEKAIKHRNGLLAKFPSGKEFLEQMILYFLDASRVDRLNETQKRTIIKDLIKLY